MAILTPEGGKKEELSFIFGTPFILLLKLKQILKLGLTLLGYNYKWNLDLKNKIS